MNSRILKLQLNEPETIALATIQTMEVFNDFGKPQVLFCPADQRRLYATPELARQIKSLGVKELESFGVRKWKKGRNVHYDVWLSPASEKSRAVEEAPAIAAELANVVSMPAPEIRQQLAPTGRGSAMPMPAPRRSLALSQPPNVIPFNVAFREGRGNSTIRMAEILDEESGYSKLYEALERQSKAAAVVLRFDILGEAKLEEWNAAMEELNMATFNAQAVLLKANPLSSSSNPSTQQREGAQREPK